MRKAATTGRPAAPGLVGWMLSGAAWGRLTLTVLRLGLVLVLASGCVAGRKNAGTDISQAVAPAAGNPVHEQAYVAARQGGAALPTDCPSGAPGSHTPATPERGGTFLLFSDVHLNPFADPALVKVLAAAPAGQWHDILADSTGGLASYRQDTNNALFQSFLDDMAARVPRPDFLLFPGDLLCHRFWTYYPRITGDTSRAGLLAFIDKTVEYFLTEVTRRFPGVPLYLALGNNDSLEGDYRIAPGSPYLATTGALAARLALPDEAARAAFLATYPQYGGYAVTLPEAGGLRLIVLNDIYWSTRYPDPSVGAPVLDFLARELEAAKGRGQAVWVMTHIPPGDNVYSSVKAYAGKGSIGYAPLLVDAQNDAFVELLTAYAPTIKASFAGHVHRDDFRLFYGKAGNDPVGLMRLAPSISPVTGNNPGYQVYAYDRASHELLDVTTYAMSLGAAKPAWGLEYVYSATYGYGLRGASDWQGVAQGLAGCPPRRQAYEAFYDVQAPGDAATDATFPVFWRAIKAPTRQAFDAATSP